MKPAPGVIDILGDIASQSRLNSFPHVHVVQYVGTSRHAHKHPRCIVTLQPFVAESFNMKYIKLILMYASDTNKCSATCIYLCLKKIKHLRRCKRNLFY